jgi:hypothetical protein
MDFNVASLQCAGIAGCAAGLGGLIIFNLEPYDAFIVAVLAAGAKLLVDYICRVWWCNSSMPAHSQSNFQGMASNMPHGISNTGLYSSVIPGT